MKIFNLFRGEEKVNRSVTHRNYSEENNLDFPCENVSLSGSSCWTQNSKPEDDFDENEDITEDIIGDKDDNTEECLLSSILEDLQNTENETQVM